MQLDKRARAEIIEEQMARRVAARKTLILDFYGFMSATELADLNQSKAKNRHTLANNWKRRDKAFSVLYLDENDEILEVFPKFQFRNNKPIKTVQRILRVFAVAQKSPWNIALWFTSNNGWLHDGLTPVDLLEASPEAVVYAAQREANKSAV
jgi:hypothetical protein